MNNTVICIFFLWKCNITKSILKFNYFKSSYPWTPHSSRIRTNITNSFTRTRTFRLLTTIRNTRYRRRSSLVRWYFPTDAKKTTGIYSILRKNVHEQTISNRIAVIIQEPFCIRRFRMLGEKSVFLGNML